MVYQWRFAMGVPAQTAGNEFERIERKHGHITPEIVLDESRAEDSALHSCFEWNDEVAAEKYRIQQATHLIVNLTVFSEHTEQKAPVRAFVNVSTERKGSFISVSSAMQATKTREVVLKNALRELESFKAKYKNLVEFSELFAAIEKIAV